MLLFPLEAPGRLLFLSRADRAGGKGVVAVHCWADEAHLPRGSACSANCWEGREGQGERNRARAKRAWRCVESVEGGAGLRSEALCVGRSYSELASI